MGEALLKRQKLQGKDPTDDFPYDVEIDMPATGKLDILYTADIHCGWKDFGSNRWASQVFSLDKNSLTGSAYNGGDVKAYKELLISSGRPTYVLDCGDYSKGGNYRTTSTYSDEAKIVNHSIDMMKAIGYFGVTTGNHEFKWKPIGTAFTYVNKLNGYGLMATNLMNSSNSPMYPGTTSAAITYIANKTGVTPGYGFKTIRVGNKKIGIIGVSYPSPNGTDTYGEYDEDNPSGSGRVEWNSSTYRWNYKDTSGNSLYRWFDSIGYNSEDSNWKTTAYNKQSTGTVSYNPGGCMYREVNTIATALKQCGFDYIIAFGHMDKFSDENYSADDRFFSRADFLLRNVNNVDVFIPGHLNSSINTVYHVKSKGSSTYDCDIAPEAGGEMNSFGRLEIDLITDTISYRLLRNIDHLHAVDMSGISAPTEENITY